MPLPAGQVLRMDEGSAEAEDAGAEPGRPVKRQRKA